METRIQLPVGKKARATTILHVSLLYALVIAAGLATNPFFDMGFNDDWVYSLIATRFAHTGHLTYVGAAYAAVLVQTVYGALLTKVFGGTFVVHRLGTLFIAGFIPILVYQTGRRLRLYRGMALFAALTIGLSPIFIPHAVSFMTDLYGCLFTLAAIYAGIRSVQAESGRSAIVWFVAGMVLAFVGGLNRQLVWMAGPPIFAAYCVARYKQGHRRLLAAAAITAVYVLGCWYVNTWLQRQPGVASEGLDTAVFTLMCSRIRPLFRQFGGLFLTSLVLAIPALAAGVRIGRNDARTNTVGFLGGLLVFLMGYWKAMFVFPHQPNVLTQYGLFLPDLFLPGDLPVVLPMWVCRLLPALACGLGLKLLANWVLVFRQAGGRIPRAVQPPDEARKATIVSALLPCAFALLYLLPIAVLVILHRDLFDRYALPILPFVVIAIVAGWQRTGVEKPGLGAYALLIAFSVYGIAITHDHFALSKARLKAVEVFEARGVSRDRFLAGYEHDMWWQASEHSGLTSAASPKRAPTNPDVWYLGVAPALQPLYFVSTSRLPGLYPCTFEPIIYVTWLSPRRRELVVLCGGGQEQEKARTVLLGK